jgi:putative tryptophan/tyrosine transport system substrate-binding protein
MKIGRRAFCVLGGAMIAAPGVARSQQPLPLIGFLHSATIESYIANAAGFADGLAAAGFTEAQNLEIEYRFADGQPERLPSLAADLIGRQPAAIVAGGARAALAARAATSTIPIVFVFGSDPVRLGLVAGLPRPGGNVTGVTFVTTGLVAKKLALLRDLVPRAKRVGFLAETPRDYGPEIELVREIVEGESDIRTAADTLGWQVVVAEVGGDRDYETAFTKFADARADAVILAPSEAFATDADDLVALAARREMPTVWPRRADVESGGLMSYGARQPEAWRLGGLQVGHILKGTKPAEMAITPSAKVELVISPLIAKSLDLTVPPRLRALADAVIE